MAVETVASTLPGGVTPVCGECGVHLCWDISDSEYADARAFWDAWICANCNGGRALSLKRWYEGIPETSLVGVEK